MNYVKLCSQKCSDLMHSWLNGLANRLTSDASMPQDARPDNFKEIRLCLPASTSKQENATKLATKWQMKPFVPPAHSVPAPEPSAAFVPEPSKAVPLVPSMSASIVRAGCTSR